MSRHDKLDVIAVDPTATLPSWRYHVPCRRRAGVVQAPTKSEARAVLKRILGGAIPRDAFLYRIN